MFDKNTQCLKANIKNNKKASQC